MVETVLMVVHVAVVFVRMLKAVPATIETGYDSPENAHSLNIQNAQYALYYKLNVGAHFFVKTLS